MGMLDVHHVNGRYVDNDPVNLMKLCRSHHRLVENGRIDLDAPVMPPFRTGTDGKRRYK